MKRAATLVAVVAWLAAGGLGFVEVACIHRDCTECVLPIAQACDTCDDDCPDDECDSIRRSPCDCGPCVDLPIAASLLLDASAPPPEGASLCVELPSTVPAPALSVQDDRACPAGPSPPLLAPPPVLRC